jgi:hypothetical protein
VPWDALGENPCATLLPAPPLVGVPYGVHPNSEIEVCVKISGVVIGHNSFTAGDAQVSIRDLLAVESRMMVVKSVKMKPPEVAPLEMLSIRDVHMRLRRVELSSCRSSRKSEWRHPQLVRQRARRSSSYLGFLLMSNGRE